MTAAVPRYPLWSVLLLLACALPLRAQTDAASRCSQCHSAAVHDWSVSLHRNIFQPATEQNVSGDFSQAKVVLHGSTYLLQHRGGKFYIVETRASGKPIEQRVDYVLGRRRLQHYLSTQPDGRILILAPTWDTARKQWIAAQDDGNPEETTAVWNKSCASCHASGVEKNFDPRTLRYATTWQAFGVTCERCHGPSDSHVTRASGITTLDAGTRAIIDEVIVNPARLDPLRSTAVCAQCHSRRDTYARGFRPGANFSDFFMPVLPYRLARTDSAYWADGRPRQMSNEVVGFWQSQCFLKGNATCSSCHTSSHGDVAGDALLRTTNAACAKCHADIAGNVAAHSHHAANSSGSSCVACHMPEVVSGMGAAMRDHSISVPVPENTVALGIPNACNQCHQDKDAAWAAQKMTAWYGDKSRQKFIRRANAFAGAGASDPASIPSLLQILNDLSAPPLIRANAAGYLGRFPDEPEAYNAVVHTLSDPDPLLRATAAAAIEPHAAQREPLAPILIGLLRDPAATVRVNAFVALASMGVPRVGSDDQEAFDAAKQLYHAKADLHPDDAQQQFAAGKIFVLAGELDWAMQALSLSKKLDPSIPAGFYEAQALAGLGDLAAARKLLLNLPRNDPQFPLAQKLLVEIELRQPPPPNPAEAKARSLYLDGQLLLLSNNHGAALKLFDDSLSAAPNSSWAARAQIGRAICLEKLSRADEAEPLMKLLSAAPAGRSNPDLQLAYVELLYDSGRIPEALQRVDALIASVPKIPQAYWWRARLLLQLHRTDEAAKAAEEAVRLQPELAAPHSLLVRIYQLQGRAKEAAEQAQWLREYQRRSESR